MISNNSIVSRCVIRDTCYGLKILASSNTTISDCIIANNSYTGLKLDATNGPGPANNDTIFNCTFIDNHVFGMDIEYTRNCTFSHLTVINSSSPYYIYSSGIHMVGAHYNEISYCNISKNNEGISFDHSANNKIFHCNIFSNDRGINIYHNSDENIISSCTFSYNYRGVEIYNSVNNIISLCSFSNNVIGAETQSYEKNTIINNNFFKNKIHGYFLQSVSTWDSNYYDNWKGFGRKIIFGLLPPKFNNFPFFLLNFFSIIPSRTFDLHPAKKPYDIP